MRIRSVLAQARLDRHEIAGSLGDLGTFLPLLVGMMNLVACWFGGMPMTTAAATQDG